MQNNQQQQPLGGFRPNPNGRNQQQQQRILRNNNNNANAIQNNPQVNQVQNQGQQAALPQQAGFDILTIHNGVITTFKPMYRLGVEGEFAFRRYFSHLSTEGDDGARPGLRFNSRKSHPHPVGAAVRALFHDKLLFGTLRKKKHLDIGTSPARLQSRFYETGEIQPIPVTEWVHSLAPITCGRDIMRHYHHGDDVQNMCQCKGGVWGAFGTPTARCQKCLTNTYKYSTSIDSIYYPGVLEEVADQADLCEGHIHYAVFNDYDKMRLQYGSVGRACDNESVACIDSNMFVTSTVVGNVAPYHHQILKTEGLESWQYLVRSSSGRWFYMVFEVIDEFQNGDIPYRMCRVTPISVDKLLTVSLANKTDETEGVQGVPYFENIWVKPSFEEKNDKEMINKIKVAPQTKGMPKFSAKPTKMEIPDERSTDVSVMTDREEKTPLETVILQECEKKCKPLPDDLVTDFNERKQQFERQISWYDKLLKQWKQQNNEKFYYSVDTKGLWLTLELSKPKWWSCGLLVSKNLYKAKMEDVMEAYTRIGSKHISTSIDYACTQAQREMAKERGITVMDLFEAFTIARIIRAQQNERMEEAFEMSYSTQKNDARRKRKI